MNRLTLLLIAILTLVGCQSTQHPPSETPITAPDAETGTWTDDDIDMLSSLAGLFESEEVIIAAEAEKLSTEYLDNTPSSLPNQQAITNKSDINKAVPIDTNKSSENLLLASCDDIDCANNTDNIVTNQNTTEQEVDTQKVPTLWPRMRKGFGLNLDIDNPRFNAQLNWYKKHQPYLDRTATRASRYLYHIVNETEKRNMPLELALLPIVESAFDPFAYSHGRASGIWQFIPGTGKAFGLKQNWWYDGRRDIVASTDAALRYLQKLAKRFDGDWLLALAAYNSGGGTVSKAIRYNKKRGLKIDFWSLKLPKETRAYVPKLMAIAKLIKDPQKYGLTLKPIPDEPYFDIVKIGSQIDLAHAANLAGISVDEIYLLNPGYNRWASSPLGPHRLLIPVANADHFRQAIAALPKNQRVSWERYAIRSGDSLIRIAKKFNTTPSVIKQVNKLRSNTIRQGQKLLIPVAAQNDSYYAFSSDNRLQKKQNKVPRGGSNSKLEYVVRSGDTLWDLSRKYKVGVRSLAKWNSMAPTDPLKPGVTLVIWTKSPITTSAYSPPGRSQIRKVGYKVRKGDSLARIANKFNVSIKDIITWNNINPKKYLKPGQRIKLYVDVTNGT